MSSQVSSEESSFLRNISFYYEVLLTLLNIVVVGLGSDILRIPREAIYMCDREIYNSARFLWFYHVVMMSRYLVVSY